MRQFIKAVPLAVIASIGYAAPGITKEDTTFYAAPTVTIDKGLPVTPPESILSYTSPNPLYDSSLTNAQLENTIAIINQTTRLLLKINYTMNHPTMEGLVESYGFKKKYSQDIGPYGLETHISKAKEDDPILRFVTRSISHVLLPYGDCLEYRGWDLLSDTRVQLRLCANDDSSHATTRYVGINTGIESKFAAHQISNTPYARNLSDNVTNDILFNVIPELVQISADVKDFDQRITKIRRQERANLNDRMAFLGQRLTDSTNPLNYQEIPTDGLQGLTISSGDPRGTGNLISKKHSKKRSFLYQNLEDGENFQLDIVVFNPATICLGKIDGMIKHTLKTETDEVSTFYAVNAGIPSVNIMTYSSSLYPNGISAQASEDSTKLQSEDQFYIGNKDAFLQILVEQLVRSDCFPETILLDRGSKRFP